MSGFNVFSWIREGVRQSVLLGVSDALEHLGTNPNGEDGRVYLQELAQRGNALPEPETTKAETKPKRLGRSLRDLEQQ